MIALGECAVFGLAFGASAAAPGPEVAALLGRSMSRGLLRCWPLAAGIVLGKLIMLGVAVAGMAALLAALGPVFVLLQYCGGAYLIWLGTVRWRRAGRAVLAADTETNRPAMREAGLGMAMTLSNPIAVAFYLALLPGIVDVSEVAVVDYLTMATIIVVVMTGVVLAYGGAGELVRRFCAGSRARVVADRISACILCAAGLWVALR